MYICLCKAITEEQIRCSIKAGADTKDKLSAQLGVASQCGSCALELDEILMEELGPRDVNSLGPQWKESV